MAQRPLTKDAGSWQRWSRLPAPVRIGVLYVVARLITTAFLFAAAELSGPASRFGEGATVADFVIGWDAFWYAQVALDGYPSELPLTEAGQVAENQWAFMPIYAYLSAAVGAPFGAWGFGALVVSLIAGYFACLVLYRMLRLRQDPATATWAVAFFAAGPLAALFQLGYGESLFLLWLFLSIWCVMRRRYAWLYLLVPLMGYTRPGVLAFALFLGLFGIWRWASRRREALPVREIVHIVALGMLAVVVGFSWQVVAGIVTGDPGAYLATELAWRRAWIADGSGGFLPFDGWVQAAAFWFESWGLGASAGYVVLAASVVAVAALLFWDPHVRSLGVEVRLWSASYLIYLLAVFFPQTSLFRLLAPLSPLWGAVATPRSVIYRGGVLVACLGGQWWWVHSMYALGHTYWQIP